MVAEPSQIGRYTLHGTIATGGMATIHYGRFRSEGGFARTVAIKRLLPVFAGDPGFVTMLIDEARLAARIRHPNVVQTLDVIHQGEEVLLVLEYVHGASVGRVVRALAERGERVPIPIAAAIVAGALHGVHAAHEAKDESNQPLELIHRDLSPDNLLLDESGVVRVVDFGIAKARGRAQQATKPGGLKGKLPYMAPEQVHGDTSRRSDLFSMGVVLWELLVGERLFDGAHDAEILAAVLTARVARPSKLRPEVPAALESVVLQSLRRSPGNRYATALEMALAIEQAVPIAAASEVASWMSALFHDELEARRREVAEIERAEMDSAPADAAASSRASPSRASRGSRPSRLSRRLLVAALAVGLLLLLVVVAAGRSTRTDADGAAVPAPSTPGPSAVASAASSATFGSESPAEALAPAPAASSDPAVSSSRAPRGDRRPHGASPSGRPRSAACDPPFTIDAKGARTWKRECF